MEEKVTRGSHQARPRMHDYNPKSEERRSDAGSSETEQHKSRVRFIDEEEQRGNRPGDGSEERPQQRAKEAGTELWSSRLGALEGMYKNPRAKNAVYIRFAGSRSLMRQGEHRSPCLPIGQK